MSRIEALFEAWGYGVTRHRWLALTLSIGLTGFFAWWLPSLEVDHSYDSYLLPNDPTAASYREFRERFDRDDRIVVGIVAEDVFSIPFLRSLHALHRELEGEVPYIEKVDSLFNARATRGEGDRLIIEDLLEGWLDEWPADPSIDGLRERVMANPLYVDTLVSQDSKLATITLKPFTYSTRTDFDPLAGFEGSSSRAAEAALLTEDETQELLAALQAVVARYERPDFQIHLGGALVVTDHITRIAESDTQRFFAVAVLVTLLLLLLLFRRVSGALLPIAVTVLSVASATGIMILLGIPATTAVQTLPILLLAVGVCDAVHILTITYQGLAEGRPKHDAIAQALGHSGLPVAMTSLTTAAGMLSFVAAEMTPVVQLGIIAPIGVVLALLYTVVLLPAVLAIVPLGVVRRPQESPDSRFTRSLVRLGAFAGAHPRSVLAVAGGVLVFSLAGAMQVRFSHDILAWFEPEDPIRVAAEVLDTGLHGSMSTEVLIDTGIENGLHDPEILRRIDTAAQWATGVREGSLWVGKPLSLVDIVKETHQALNGGLPEYRRVPDERELVAQELLLFESGSEDLEEFVDTQFRTARLSLRTPIADAVDYIPLLERLEEGLVQILGEDVEVRVTGLSPVFASTIVALIKSLARSYGFAVLLITPIMILLLGDWRLGLASLVPNLLPVSFTLGLMGWMGIPLDYSTVLVGAIVIGLSVDDTIHFMHKFRVYHSQHGDPALAIRDTLASTGSALLFTTFVLAGGFFSITSAELINSRHFGFLAGTACLVAFAADLFLGPALMMLIAPDRTEDARTTPVGDRADRGGRRWSHGDDVLYRTRSVSGEGRLVNVCETGVFVRTADLPREGENVEVTLVGPSPAIVLTGEVRWVGRRNDRVEGFGVHLVDPPRAYLECVASVAAHTEPEDGAPRRIAPRLRASIPVAVEFGCTCDEGRLCDISISGALLEGTRIQPSEGEEVVLTFVLPGRRSGFEVAAHVVRRTPSGGYAVQFDVVGGDLKDLLERAIARGGL